jgi:hypothetical protein
MADNLDSPSFTFGIEDTMEMGMGNAELLSDLMSPETSTGNPDDVAPIIKEVPTDAPPKEPKPKGKEIVPVEEGKELTDQDVLTNFLGDATEEEEEELPPADIPGEPIEEEANSVFTSLSKELLKLGVFTTEEGETETLSTTPEEFLERFNAEKKKGAIEVVNNFIAQFGEDYQNAFDAIFVNGVSPKEYFGIYNNIVEFTNLDLTDELNQMAVIKQALTDQGLEPEDVTTEIERLKNYGDLESVAAKHHKVLVKKEAARLSQKEEDSKRELQQKNAIKNQYIQNVQTILQEKLKTKEFDGIPINPKLAGELQDFLLVDKWKTPSGETLTDFDRAILDMKKPENHANKVKVALLLKILEKDPTLSTIQKTGVSKQANQLFSEVARQTTKVKTSNTNQQQPKSWFSQ